MTEETTVLMKKSEALLTMTNLTMRYLEEHPIEAEKVYPKNWSITAFFIAGGLMSELHKKGE